MSKQKQREQYNWNFKKETNPKFYDWLNAQTNLSESLITLVLHFVDQYGIDDVTDYEVSKKMQRDLFMKEKFYQDISALLENANINNVHQNKNVPIAEVKEQKVEKEEKHIEKVDKKEEVKVQKESDPIEKKQKDDNYLDNVDESTIFGD
ncbi:hypothetical protein ABE44_33250 [Bacillus thuringiensis]|uniref:Uncharacterized protein n=2 Tax=Bacillus cereus group TaxID=86661 RepID=A0A9W5QN43_BACCE|nr:MULTISPECIES: hypothetical protein [Bacillus cereus group]EOP78656.1 hypothetical protein IGM_06607 [Bacillus cereus HuB4-4]MBG9503738.1 hypothetical protein [Bacillus thuringiensis]MBG9504260.1 hypothetical protein [Bacillus thuringiensis]OUB41292.1 hypothetical protein BK716_30130 [Bacillus thuringiensis serovar higo]